MQTSNGLTGNDELTHVYTFDVLGRTIADHAKAIPNGHDTTVTKITTSFDTYGRPEHFISWGGSNDATVINAVQREYNGFGQVTKEYQAHNGAVDTTPGSGSPFVEYGYTTAATGSLLSTVTYPKITGDWASSPRTVTLNYDSGLDAAIGRVSSLSDTAPGSSAAKVEEYEYLGLGAIVERNLPEPTVVQLLHDEHDDGNKISDGGDQYTGLDRFGRVIDIAWYDTTAAAFVDRFQYAYDGNSNRLYKNNLMHPHLSELYHAPGGSTGTTGGSGGFDGFDRLTHFTRGTLETINGASRLNSVELSGGNGDPYSQEWVIDEQGTWDAFDDGRTVHFDENEASGNERSITYAKADGNGVGTTSITPARVGRTFTHDAWNRLTESKANAPGLVLRDVDYEYDALGRMITHTSGSTTTDFYHSTAWQNLTEVDTNAQSQVTEVRDNVWSLAYVDAMVFQERRDAATSGGERTYPLHDANYNVTALLREVDDGEGGTEWQVTSRYVYDPYGTPTKLTLGAEVDTSDSAWNYLHQGGYLTDTDRLYHFRHRSYDPSNGQWIQRDPVGYVDGLNLHEGLMSNPISNLDPMGLDVSGRSFGELSNADVDARGIPGIGLVRFQRIGDDVHRMRTIKSMSAFHDWVRDVRAAGGTISPSLESELSLRFMSPSLYPDAELIVLDPTPDEGLKNLLGSFLNSDLANMVRAPLHDSVRNLMLAHPGSDEYAEIIGDAQRRMLEEGEGTLEALFNSGAAKKIAVEVVLVAFGLKLFDELVGGLRFADDAADEVSRGFAREVEVNPRISMHQVGGAMDRAQTIRVARELRDVSVGSRQAAREVAEAVSPIRRVEYDPPGELVGRKYPGISTQWTQMANACRFIFSTSNTHEVLYTRPC